MVLNVYGTVLASKSSLPSSNRIFAGMVVALALSGAISAGQFQLAHAAPAGTYFDHLVFIIMENWGVDNICGSSPPPCNGSNNPYMSSLANSYGLGVQYTSLIHPLTSEPNYVGIIGGSTFSCPSSCTNINAPTLIDRFQSAGLTWKGYMESMQQSSGCDTSGSQEPYNNIHNPFNSFTEFVQNGVPNTANCSGIVLANPSTCGSTDCALVNDLNSGSAPNFMWLTPNDCNNMHGASVCSNGCTSGSSSVGPTCRTDGDNYLKSLVPSILNSNTFTNSRSALFISFDEGQDYCPLNGSSSEDCIYAVWAGPEAKFGFSTTNLYNHYSFTKTIETNWNLASLTSNDANAKAMTEFFKAQAADYSLTANPSSLTFATGSTDSFTTTVSPQNGFTGTVNISTSTSPSTGLNVVCSPTSISGGSGSSTCNLSSSTTGTYTVTVTGTSGTTTHSASVSVTLTASPNPDFSISSNPSSLSFSQGTAMTSTITLNSLNSFAGTVTLTSQVSPTGPTASLNPASVSLSSNGAASSTLTVSTGNDTPGSYAITVTGTGGSISHTTTVTATITASSDFSISASPSSLSLGQGSSGVGNPVTVTSSGDSTWFESSYLANSFNAQGLTWLFFEDSSMSCEGMSGCLYYTTSSTGSSWTARTSVNVHVTDSDFSVYTDGTNVYYVRYDESTFESTCGRSISFRAGTLNGSTGTVSWQPEQVALAGLTTNVYPNDEIILDSTGQAWIAFLSDSHSACGGNGTDLPQVIHSSGTNYASWTSPLTLSTAHSNNWHVALVSLGAGQVYASYWLANADLHGKLFDGSTWGADEQISSTTTQNDVNAWLFNSGTNVYAIYFDNGPETFNFAARSSSGSWTNGEIGVGESRTGSKFSSSYYSFPDSASYDQAHNQFYFFWMNATLQRIDQWKGAGNSWTKTTGLVNIAPAPYPDSIESFITPSSDIGGIYYVTGSSSFTYNFVSLPLSGGSSGTFTVTITGQNGFTGTVSLTTAVNPSTGLTVSCSPTSITGGSGVSTCTVTGSTSGTYTITITGTSGSLSHSTTVNVSVGSSPDFTVTATPTNLAVNTGTSGGSTIAVAPTNGFTGTVNLTVSTSSSVLSCNLSSNTITGGSGSSTLTCNGSSGGNFIATVSGTSGSLSHSATVTYQVTSSQDFTIGSNPSGVSANTGVPGNSTIRVGSLNGFSGTVSLGVITDSSNLSCSLSRPTISGGSGSSTLSCTGTVSGNYVSTVTGTSGTLSHSTSVTYAVSVPLSPDFTISASPNSITISLGATASSTITIGPVNGFTGTVTLSSTTSSSNLVCNLSTSTVSGGSGSSTLSCGGTISGSYSVTVNAASGSVTHTVTVSVRVKAHHH